MSRISYVNGAYVPHPLATTHIEDRGYQFADGVYEVIALVKGNLLDLDPHLDRLDTSLEEVKIPSPVSRKTIKHIIQQVIHKNRLQEGMIYIQVSRGIAPRTHEFPSKASPVLVVSCRYVCPKKLHSVKQKGVKVLGVPEIRWARPDIKSISLLPNILSKQYAIDQGFYDAIFINEKGILTESSSTNFWIISSEGILKTHPAAKNILNGITRQRLIKLVEPLGLSVEEHPFTLEEALEAQEAFLSSSVSGIVPVIQINEKKIGSGKPGTIVSQLIQLYERFACL